MTKKRSLPSDGLYIYEGWVVGLQDRVHDGFNMIAELKPAQAPSLQTARTLREAGTP